MKAKSLFPAILIFLSFEALAVRRMACPRASSEVPEGKTINDYQQFFDQNKIIPKTALSLNFVEQFKNEFEKFPATLHQELVRAGNKIHIMEGDGVTVDPTWDSHDQFTFDGRPWKDVPGGGGSTARGYLKTPTRIVINHLYDHHGSVSMFLHEHGHSLDSIRAFHGISRSDVWHEVYNSEPNAVPFLTTVCGSYCTNNVEEGFAELFANYHGCAESRTQMEQEVPKIAEFFRRFVSTRNLENIMSDDPSAQVVSEPEVSEDQPAQPQARPIPDSGAQPQSRHPRFGCRRIFGREICL